MKFKNLLVLFLAFIFASSFAQEKIVFNLDIRRVKKLKTPFVTSILETKKGVGLRFIHKKIFNAIFRIDFGFGLTQGSSRAIVFGIGQYF